MDGKESDNYNSEEDKKGVQKQKKLGTAINILLPTKIIQFLKAGLKPAQKVIFMAIASLVINI